MPIKGAVKLMDAILARRSIRKYIDRPVSDQIVRELLEAAMSAPSAKDERPWHFIVIRDREILDEIPHHHPYAQMLKQAQLAIMVCADMKLDKCDGFWVQDCSAATENILIAAQAKGLGACWVGIYPVKERVEILRKLLGMPDHVVPLSLVPIGYPAEYKPPANRYDATRIHYDRW